DLEETQATFGSKSNTSSINTSESNDFIFCDHSDKSSASETYDFASCVSSPKTNDSFSTIDVKILPKSDVKDPSSTNGFPSCSFKENVKPPKNLCNKSGKADRIHCKNNFVRTKKCFVCGNRSHLIKDCDVYDTVDNFPYVILKAAYVPAGSRNSLASTSAGRPIPAASRNRPASIHAGRHIPAGRCNKPAHFPAGRSVPTGWTNHAARPFFRPTNLYFNNVSWPGIYEHMSMNEGRWGSVVKSSTGNKEKLDDFVQIKGGTVTFEGGDSKITGKGTIRTSKLNFENVYYVEELQHFNLFYLPDESQVVLRIPRRHDLYTFNLSDIQLDQQINCLLAKASLEESTKWHKKMTHVNFKTINKLAKHGLVEGLPLKLFTNEHNCVACNKGKQHKASYKAISARRTIYEPLKLLNMDLFGPTSIRSINHKYYSLVVTDDFSRFSWAFFLGTKDETFYILKDFIALIKNQLNKKVKAISDHLGKFDGKANDGFLVGYAAHSKAYRVYNLSSKKAEETLNLRYLEDKPNVQGLGQEWYFDLDYLTDSLGYTCFKTNTPAGTQDTIMNAGPKVNDVSAPMKNNLDYAEELARLQRQEHEAHSVAAKYGFEFSNETVEMLHQAEIETRRHLVLAAGDPAGSIVSTGGVPAGSVPVGSVPASHVPARIVPAGGVLAGSIDSAGFGDPAASESVPAVLPPDHAANSTLHRGLLLGSSEHSTRFLSHSDLGNHQPTAGIFSFSSYDDDFCADVTNLASNVSVDPVATKRVNTIHPRSQIIGELQSPVQTMSTV
nr:putative ribonuclease H-like domain-containing protein [Tanacetum cinerariifolium]